MAYGARSQLRNFTRLDWNKMDWPEVVRFAIGAVVLCFLAWLIFRD